MGGFGRFVEPVGILAIFNALGRIFWGKVSDVIDRPRAMMIMFLAQGMAFMLLVSVESHLAVFVASAWVGLNFGGNFALFPSATADYFGTKNFGMNYGWIFTAYGVAGILGPVVGGVLFDVTEQYVLAFVFAGILCFVAAASSVVVWALARRPRMNAAQMCAHCAEVAEVAGGKPLTGTPWYVRLLGGLIKKMVLSDRPYPRSTRTHPQYVIPTTVEFDAQKARLLGFWMRSTRPALPGLRAPSTQSSAP